MNLDDMQKLCDEATPGPWSYEDAQQGFFRYPDIRDPVGDKLGEMFRTRNAAFVTACRILMPKLLAVAEAAKNIHEHNKTHLGGSYTVTGQPLDFALKSLEDE